MLGDSRNTGSCSIQDTHERCKCSRIKCCFVVLLSLAVLFYYLDDFKLPVIWKSSWWEEYGPKRHSPDQRPLLSLNFSATTNISKPDTDIIMDAGAPEPYYVAYPKKYNFTLNEPLKCQEEKPFVAVVVPVAPQDQTHRDAIRSTWGSERLILNKVVSFFFLLGLPSGDGSAHVQEDILQESREHQDILQANFLDSYYNLTIKTMVMLEWLSMHCTDISYAMKIDSDMFLNVHNLIQLLLQAPKINYMTGLVAKGGIVLRDPSSKWYIPQEVFPEPFYPPYALGLGYVLSIDLSLKLVEAAKNVKALYIEDVYLGLCMKQLGIPPTDPPNQSLFNVFPVDYSRCQYSKLIATTTNSLNDQVNFWTDLQKPGPPC